MIARDGCQGDTMDWWQDLHELFNLWHLDNQLAKTLETSFSNDTPGHVGGNSKTT